MLGHRWCANDGPVPLYLSMSSSQRAFRFAGETPTLLAPAAVKDICSLFDAVCDNWRSLSSLRWGMKLYKKKNSQRSHHRHRGDRRALPVQRRWQRRLLDGLQQPHRLIIVVKMWAAAGVITPPTAHTHLILHAGDEEDSPPRFNCKRATNVYRVSYLPLVTRMAFPINSYTTVIVRLVSLRSRPHR